MTTCSPYACSPVAVDFGPGLATYWVPKHLLRSPKWSTTDAGGTLCLPGVSAATGHTLVHYLYTGTYQALEAKGEDSATPAHIKFKQGLLVFILASTYELPDLKRLAKEQIEILGSCMALVEILDTVRKEFSKMASSWFHEYLQDRAKMQFDLDYTFFTSKAFIESVGKGTLQRFMTCHLLEIFSDKLTHTLQRRESRCQGKEKPGTMSDEVEDAAIQTHHCVCYPGRHETDMRTTSDEMSFEFPNASCKDVNNVISLDTSSAPDCAIPESAIEEVPPLEVGDIHEDHGMVQSEPNQLCEEPYEPTYANEVEEREDTAPVPDLEVLPLDEAARVECLTVDANLEPEPTPPEPEKKEEDVPWSFTFGGTTKDKKKKKGAAKETPSPPLESRPPAEPETVPELEPVKEEYLWGFAATATGKEKKRKKGKEEPKIDEPSPPPLEPELVPVKEEPAVHPFATAAAAETEKKKDDTWGDWGIATTTIGKKKKKKKGVVEEEPIPVPEVPEPEPAANPEAFPKPEACPKLEQEYKPKPESSPEETIPETSSTLCPRRSHHLLKGDRWNSCERCRAMLREIAVQLATENKTVLLPE